MPIVKTGPNKKGHSLSSKIKCWECNRPSAVFAVSPSSGNNLCADCAPELFEGIISEVKRGKKASSG